MTWSDFLHKQARSMATKGGYSQCVARLIADEAVRLYRRDNSPADAIKKAMSKASKLYKKA